MRAPTCGRCGWPSKVTPCALCARMIAEAEASGDPLPPYSPEQPEEQD